jgi:hypothetical protein
LRKIWLVIVAGLLICNLAGCSGGGGNGNNGATIGNTSVSDPAPTATLTPTSPPIQIPFNAALTAYIVHSPSAPEGQDFSTILDDNPDDYAVSYDMPPCTLIIALKQQLVISQIDLIWGSKNNYGINYTIFDTDLMGNIIGEIAHIRNTQGKEQTITLTEPSHSAFIRIDIESTTGTPPVMLRQIRIRADYEKDFIAEIMNSHDDGIFLAADNPDNPLHILRYPTFVFG